MNQEIMSHESVEVISGGPRAWHVPYQADQIYMIMKLYYQALLQVGTAHAVIIMKAYKAIVRANNGFHEVHPVRIVHGPSSSSAAHAMQLNQSLSSPKLSAS